MVLPLHSFLILFIYSFCLWPITALPSLIPPAFIQLWQSLAPAHLITAFQQRQTKPLWQMAFIHSPTLKREKFKRKILVNDETGTKPCVLHITIQQGSLWSHTAWKWYLTWHFLFSLGAAAEPQRGQTSHSDSHTQCNRTTTFYYQSTAGISSYSPADQVI